MSFRGPSPQDADGPEDVYGIDQVAGAGNERTVDAQLELMDRQIVDDDDRMVAKVDDVALAEREDGHLVVTGLLTGPGVLGPRLGGALGSITTAIWSRLSGRDPTDPKRIDISLVSGIATVITLHVSRRTADVDGFETWMRDRVIAATPPGTGPAPHREQSTGIGATIFSGCTSSSQTAATATRSPTYALSAVTESAAR